MLKLMRENAGSWVVKVLLGIIVLVFVFWGVGSVDSKKNQEVATVNDESITVDEYRQTYNMLINQMRQRFQNNFSDEMIEMLQLEKQALTNIIDRKIMLQESRELNMTVTDEELVESIRNVNVFKNQNGAFDQTMYTAILRQNNLTPELFEAQQKESLMIEKLRSFILSNVKVSENEMLEWYQYQNTSVDINYVFFSQESHNDINPSDEEIEAYYKENGEKYKTDPKARASYVKISADEYKSTLNIPDEDIKMYYEENTEEFSSPKTVAARHILIKIMPEATEKMEADAKARITDILEMAKKGEDFAELAKKYSEGPSKTSGGYLNAFKYEDMVKPFSDKAFSMKKDEISDPVRTQFGWHIIKVEEVNEETKLSIEEAKPEISRKLSERKSKTLAYDEAEKIYNALIDGDDLEQAADSIDKKIITTDVFSQKDKIVSIQDSSKFAQIAFSLPLMETSDIEELSDGYYIIRLNEKIAPQIPELSEVIGKVTVDLKSKMQDEAAANEANEFLTALKNGAQIDEECEKKGLVVKSTGLFKREEAIPVIGYERGISQAAFELSETNPLPSNVQKSNKGYYVIRLKERKTPDASNFLQEKKNIADSLMNKKKNSVFTSWLAQIKNESVISIKEGFLE